MNTTKVCSFVVATLLFASTCNARHLTWDDDCNTDTDCSDNFDSLQRTYYWAQPTCQKGGTNKCVYPHREYGDDGHAIGGDSLVILVEEKLVGNKTLTADVTIDYGYSRHPLWHTGDGFYRLSFSDGAWWTGATVHITWKFDGVAIGNGMYAKAPSFTATGHPYTQYLSQNQVTRDFTGFYRDGIASHIVIVAF